MVFSNFRFINPGGTTVFEFDCGCREGVQDRDELLRKLYRHNFIGPPTVLMRKSAWQASGSAFSDSVLFHDHLMWLRIAIASEVGFLGVSDAAYRVHQNQVTQHEFAQLGQHRLALLEAIDEFLPPEFPASERRRGQASSHLRSSLEAFERRALRTSAREALQALKVHPSTPFDPAIIGAARRARRQRARMRSVWTA